MSTGPFGRRRRVSDAHPHGRSRRPNSRRTDRIVIKLGQKLRLVCANIPVKFQLDRSNSKEKVRMACVDDDPSSRPDLPPDRHNSLRNDRMFVKLGQNVRLVSAKLSVKFQLDCSSIKEKVRMACVHGFESTRTRGAFREDNRLRPVMVLTPFVVIG